jgi:hypothetical protein
MSLKLLQPGGQPFGQFDGLDAQALTLKGGEVVTLTSVLAVSTTDKAAHDSFDGYTNPSSTQKRPVVTSTLDGYSRPLFLADEGIAGYGTLFGTVVGGTVGQVSTGGTVLGPHTASGSGKVTCWANPGLYAVSLDACDTNSTTGLQPTHATLDTGDALYFTTAGLLTPNSAAAPGGTGGAKTVVGRFVDFETNGSLVTTPNNLVAAINGPALQTFSFATFYFAPPLSEG